MCEVVCPVQCIDVIVDRGGFLCPTVDETRCPSVVRNASHSYSAYRSRVSRREEIRAFSLSRIGSEISSSGGAAFAITMRVIRRSEGCCEAALSMIEGVARHQNLKQSMIFVGCRGSKYVQSDAQEGYRLCISMLEDDREVFVRWHSNQVAAVKGFAQIRMALSHVILFAQRSHYHFGRRFGFQNSRGFLVPQEDVQFRTSDKQSRANYELCCKGCAASSMPDEKDPYYSLFVKSLVA